MHCNECERKKDTENGICSSIMGKDGFPVRCVGEWSKEKHFYLEKYIDIFTTAMRAKKKLVYIDLFCGPGQRTLF